MFVRGLALQAKVPMGVVEAEEEPLDGGVEVVGLVVIAAGLAADVAAVAVDGIGVTAEEVAAEGKLLLAEKEGE